MRFIELQIPNSQANALAADALLNRRCRRTEAFPSAWRPAVNRLARLAPAFEDLADSFPALLFALATGYGDDAGRRDTMAAVANGLPLKEAAQRLGLPFWLRKLPAGAFNAPLVSPPSDPALVSRLISLIPQTPAAAAAWLDRVLVAHHVAQAIGRTDLALWVAQQYRGPQPSARSTAFLGVLAWAWFAADKSGRRGGQLLTERWTPTLGARRAAAEARLWQERIALDVCLGGGLADTWLANGEAGGLSFVALRTTDDFIAEARAMDNCLDRYADRLEGRAARVFSVRRDGRSIADLEIAAHEREPGHPMIAQLRGPHNRRAALDVWQAAYAWIGAQPLRLADKRVILKTKPSMRSRRLLEIWSPFLAALPAHAHEALVASLSGKKPPAKVARTRTIPVS